MKMLFVILFCATIQFSSVHSAVSSELELSAFFAVSTTGRSSEARQGADIQGWIIHDRWDALYLYKDMYLWRIGVGAREQLLPFAGQPVTLHLPQALVKAGLKPEPSIEKVESVTKVALPQQPAVTLGLMARLEAEKAPIPRGDPVDFMVMVQYAGTKEYQFSPGHLVAIVLREATPAERKQDGWPSVIVQRNQAFNALLAHDTSDYYRHHSDIFPFLTGGGILNTKGPFDYETSMERLFEPGAYQMWIGYPRYSGDRLPCFMSRIVSFQVTDRTEAIRDTSINLIKSFWRAAKYSEEETARSCINPSGLQVLSEKDSNFAAAFQQHQKLSKEYSFERENLGWSEFKGHVTVETKMESFVYFVRKDDSGKWVITEISRSANKR